MTDNPQAVDELDEILLRSQRNFLLDEDMSNAEIRQQAKAAIQARYIPKARVVAALQKMLPDILLRSANKGHVQKHDVDKAVDDIKAELGLEE